MFETFNSPAMYVAIQVGTAFLSLLYLKLKLGSAIFFLQTCGENQERGKQRLFILFIFCFFFIKK